MVRIYLQNGGEALVTMAQRVEGSTMPAVDSVVPAIVYMTIRNAAMTAAEVNGWTTYSHVSYRPVKVALSSPTNGTSTKDTTPTLSWYGASGAVRYQVQISRSTSFSTLVRNVGVTGTSYTTPTGLTRGYTYYWRVRALDNYGSGERTTAPAKGRCRCMTLGSG